MRIGGAARVLAKVLAAALGAAALVVAVPNAAMVASQRGNIVEPDTAARIAADAPFDCIVVLGAAVQPDGEPSTILADRIQVAADLYFAGVAPKIVMSGDDESDRETYDEVTNMKRYAVEALGVPSEDVFCDHAGINTYDSMYRARHVFGARRLVVVTQTYHLYRALFDAWSFHMDAIGVPSDLHGYARQRWFSLRECGARVSDMRKILARANATYLSEPVDLGQSGDVTTW